MRVYPERRLAMVIMTNSTKTYDFDPVLALLARHDWSSADKVEQKEGTQPEDDG